MKYEESLSLRRRMRAAGIALYIEEDDVQGPRPLATGLVILQTGGVTESTALEMDACGTGYMINLRITSNIPGPFAITDFGLELPWKDASFAWLAEPRGYANPLSVYCFPGERPLEFPREVVINHFANVRRQFSLGESIEGLLLGFGGPMPDRIKHGEEIPVVVNVFDQFGQKYPAPVILWASRSKRILSATQKKVPRRNIVGSPNSGFDNNQQKEGEIEVKK